MATIWNLDANDAHAFTASTPSIPEGVYATQRHGAHVVFEACADDPDKLCGRMIWAWDSEMLAPGHSIELLGGFEWDGEHWTDGWLANPEDGRTYRGKIALQPGSALKLKGCALVFCQTQIWRRVESVPGCVAAPESKKAGRNTPPGFFMRLRFLF